MDEVSIEKVNEVWVRVNADPGVKMELSDYFTFEVPGAKFMPAVRNKVWDGKVRLLNAMTGMIYRGLVPYIIKFCDVRDYKVTLETGLLANNQIPESAGYDLAKEFSATFTPRDYQNTAVVHALKYDRAMLLSPTASGKSLIIYLLTRFHIEANGRKVLIIVPTTSLVEQMSSDFIEYNNGQDLSIHKIRGGVDKDVDADITISTWQSVYKLRKDWFAKFNVIIGDEAHLFKAKSLTSILEKLPDCKYRYGFTGTLDGTETNKLVLEGLFGSVFEVTQTKKLIADKTLADFGIVAIVLQYPDAIRKQTKGKTYQEEIDFIVTNDSRNKYIRNLAHSLSGNTLILFQFVEKHGKVLYPLLKKEGKNVHFIHGGIGAEEREDVRRFVETSDDNIICASYGTFSTGINIKRLDNIIFASPSKSKIRNLQSIGRVLRKSSSDSKATLYDIVDDLQWKQTKNFATKHFMERVSIYNDEGFEYKIYNVNIGG
jgi:superfamily II DNA or RNA helicase